MRTSMVHAVLAVLVGVACSDSVSVPTTWTATLTVGSETPAPTGTSTLGGTAVVGTNGISMAGFLAGTGSFNSTNVANLNVGGSLTVNADISLLNQRLTFTRPPWASRARSA